MTSSEVSTSERLQAARKRYEELKRRNKIPLKRAHLAGPNATESSDKSIEGNDSGSNGDGEGARIHDLHETIELQKQEIRKLRDENTELKLDNMDTKEKVAELEKEIAILRLESPKRHISEKKETSNPFLESNSVSNEATEPQKPIIPVHSPKSSTGDFRESILAWKGWQVDMRDWSGSHGSQVAL